jgi:hypothetical protein
LLVKCKCHGYKIERDTAYKININGKNEYYCNEKEYLKIIEEKRSRVESLNLINEIFGYIVTNTILFKELTDISNIYTYKKIYYYIKENKYNLEKFMNKDFNNEYGKIKYFTTILKNNLHDIKIIEKEIIKQIDAEIIENIYKPKQRKKSLEEYLAEME